MSSLKGVSFSFEWEEAQEILAAYIREKFSIPDELACQIYFTDGEGEYVEVGGVEIDFAPESDDDDDEDEDPEEPEPDPEIPMTVSELEKAMSGS